MSVRSRLSSPSELALLASFNLLRYPSNCVETTSASLYVRITLHFFAANLYAHTKVGYKGVLHHLHNKGKQQMAESFLLFMQYNGKAHLPQYSTAGPVQSSPPATVGARPFASGLEYLKSSATCCIVSSKVMLQTSQIAYNGMQSTFCATLVRAHILLVRLDESPFNLIAVDTLSIHT